jgi:HlyD family secretion protein
VPLIIGDFDLGSIMVANPGAPRQWDLDVAEGTVSEAQSAATIADLQVEQLTAGPRAEDLATMRAQVARAQADEQVAQVQLEQAQQAVQVAVASVRQSQAQVDLVLAGARMESVAVAEAQLDEARAGVAMLEVQRDYLSLRAPIAGVVTQRTVHEGETVVPGARLFTISTLDPVILTIYIPEHRIGRVRVGQTADVRVDAYRGQTFQGQVVHIASRAEFTPRNVRTKEERVTTVFAVQIKIPNPGRLLRPGVSASATCVEKISID